MLRTVIEPGLTDSPGGHSSTDGTSFVHDNAFHPMVAEVTSGSQAGHAGTDDEYRRFHSVRPVTGQAQDRIRAETRTQYRSGRDPGISASGTICATWAGPGSFFGAHRARTAQRAPVAGCRLS